MEWSTEAGKSRAQFPSELIIATRETKQRHTVNGKWSYNRRVVCRSQCYDDGLLN